MSGLMFTAGAAVQQFSIDTAVFARWIAGQVADPGDVPLPADFGVCAGTQLSDLVHSAIQAGVLQGDPALELGVNGSDGSDGSGFYVLLSNRSGAQQLLQLTGRWQRLSCNRNPDISASQRAMEYLESVRDEANHLLSELAAR